MSRHPYPVTSLVTATERAGDLRRSARVVVTAESRQLAALVPGRESHRSLLLAFVTGYLTGLCDQADTHPPTHPSEITAVLRGVLDALDTPEPR